MVFLQIFVRITLAQVENASTDRELPPVLVRCDLKHCIGGALALATPYTHLKFVHDDQMLFKTAIPSNKHALLLQTNAPFYATTDHLAKIAYGFFKVLPFLHACIDLQWAPMLMPAMCWLDVHLSRNSTSPRVQWVGADG
jgi:hypothetical protein